MTSTFDDKLSSCEKIYLSKEDVKPTNNKTTNIMEGLFSGLDKLNQKVKSAKAAYDKGGISGVATAMQSNYKKQWDSMTPEQKSAYDQDFKKYEAYMKQTEMDRATQTKANVHYTNAWKNVTPEAKRSYFDNDISTYARAAQAYQNVKKTDPSKEWQQFLLNDWPQIKHQSKSTNPGAPYKRDLWKDLTPAKQQALTTAGWDEQKWDAMVAANAP